MFVGIQLVIYCGYTSKHPMYLSDAKYLMQMKLEIDTRYKKQCELGMTVTGTIKLSSDLMICSII